MKKLILFTLLLFSFLIVPVSASKCDAYNHSETNFLNSKNQINNRTIFMVDAKFIASTNSGTYVYDASDNNLKLINNTEYLQSKCYNTNREVLDMCCIGDDIYMLTNKDILKFNTLTQTFSNISVPNLNGQTKISASTLDNQHVICLYPTDLEPEEGTNLEVLYALIPDDKESNGEDITDTASTFFTNKKDTILSDISEETLTFYTISFNRNQLSGSTQINNLNFIQTTSGIFMLHCFDRSVTAYSVELGDNFTTSTSTPLISPEGEIEPIVGVLTNSNNSEVIINYKSKTNIYNFTINSLTPTLTLNNSISNYPPEFSVINISVSDNTLALLGDNCYIELNLNTGKVENMVTNPQCTINYRHAQDFEYYQLTKNNYIIMSPDSKDKTDIPEGSYVVEIADILLNDDSNLFGYKYVMYTTFADDLVTNKFGYIIAEDDNLEKIELHQQTTNKIVKVSNLSDLYSYPSTGIDNLNQIKTTISINLPVEIISYIPTYYTVNGHTNTNYALIKVNGNIGFIDTKVILSADKRIILVVPNAKLIAGANIYEYADTSSTVLHKLDQATKVRIIESRNKEGFVKIAYNGPEGNYFEGYILASNVKSNSYTTLQIIGLILVILNVLFLIILIITKRKVVR